MNIDEVESGRGLRFLPSDGPKEITTEYLVELVAYCRKCQITPTRFGYLLMSKDRDIYLGISRWHYQQRRVRVRRERQQKRIDQYKRSYPGGKVQIITSGRRMIVFLGDKGDLWQ